MRRALHRFPGGVHIARRKPTHVDAKTPTLPLPEKLYLPIQQHIGIAARLDFTANEKVLKGQRIAVPHTYVSAAIHAPTSGHLSTLHDHPVIHPGGIAMPCVALIPDGADAPAPALAPLDIASASAAEIFARIEAAGIVGMGGAGFPTHIKTREGATLPVRLMIINGVECEPIIMADDRLVQERAREVVAGANIVGRALQAQAIIIAVEADMQHALAALQEHAADGVEIIAVPEIYPAGGEKQLIFTLTGTELGSGRLPIEYGIVVLNVATVAAVYRAVVDGESLIERYVTVVAHGQTKNVIARIGTPLDDVLRGCDVVSAATDRVIAGGPMMGVEVSDLSAPITKTTCGVIVTPRADERASRACIRCGECVGVCPVRLQPHRLLDAIKTSDFDRAQDLLLFDCIECGCCAYVCPSHIPLVHYYRYAKAEVETLDEEAARAAQARERYEARLQRLQAQGENPDPSVDLVDLDGYSRAELAAEVETIIARAARRRDDKSDSSA